MQISNFKVASTLICCVALAATPVAGLAQNTDPAPTHRYPASEVIKGRYIVTLKAEVQDAAQEADRLVRSGGGRLHHTFKHGHKGFAASLTDAELAKMRNNPSVEAIEPDQIIRLHQLSPENQATWGLDRIDQTDRPLDSQYHFNLNGAGVTAFVIDTGLSAEHLEFTGRVLPGYNVVADANGTNDCNGHGTHVAGSLGGSTWGVAKAVKLVPVRVLDCTGAGTLSGVMAGVDWVSASPLRPAVANLSLGSSKSLAFNAAVAAAVAKGVTVVVAAGNSAADACNYSPASEPTALSVGASTSVDARAAYSNFGTCVAIFAPGSGITSSWIGSTSASNTISGTSMASPHVAGVAALALQANPQATPAAVLAFLVSNASNNRLSTVGTGSPNRLVYSLASGAPVAVLKQTVAVKSLVTSTKLSRSSWQAFLTASVRDVNSGLAVSNALVAGTFAPGGARSCTTTSTGSCKLSSAVLPNTTPSTSLTVLTISGPDLIYDASQNAATQVTINKP